MEESTADHTLIDPATGETVDFESAKRARYERLSLLTLDMAERAGQAANEHSALREARGFNKAMAAMSRAIWAHQIIERLRMGKPLSRGELKRLALGSHVFYRNQIDEYAPRPKKDMYKEQYAPADDCHPRPNNDEGEIEEVQAPIEEQERPSGEQEEREAAIRRAHGDAVRRRDAGDRALARSDRMMREIERLCSPSKNGAMPNNARAGKFGEGLSHPGRAPP